MSPFPSLQRRRHHQRSYSPDSPPCRSSLNSQQIDREIPQDVSSTMAKFWLCTKAPWIPVIVFLTAVAFLAPTRVSAQPAAPCSCNDLPHLINQLNRSNAALEEIQLRMSQLKSGDMFNEIAPAPNPGRATVGELTIIAIAQAADRVSDRSPGFGVFWDTASCATRVEAGTACMRSLGEFYGSIREAACRNERRRRNLTNFSDSSMFMLMSEYLMHVKDAHTRLAQEIIRRINALPASCKPGNWFGTITVNELIQVSTRVDSPPTNEYSRGSEEVTRDISNRKGTIWFNGRSTSPASSWMVSGTTSYNKASGLMVDCTGGVNRRADREERSGVHKEIARSGSGIASIEVGVSENDEDRTVSVGFTIPAVDLRGTGTEKLVVSGGCPGSNLNETRNFSTESTMDPTAVEFSVSVFPGLPKKVTGSKSIDLAPNAGAPGVTSAHTVNITVNLYKFP